MFRYSIPNSPYYVPASVGTSELSSLINGLLDKGEIYMLSIYVLSYQLVEPLILSDESVHGMCREQQLIFQNYSMKCVAYVVLHQVRQALVISALIF